MTPPLKHHLVISKPPSVNTLYGYTRTGIKYMTKKGKDWFTENLWEVKRQLPSVETVKYCKVDILLKTIRIDIDNVLKGTFDLLTKAGVIVDDAYIMELHIVKQIVHKRIKEELDVIVTAIKHNEE